MERADPLEHLGLVSAARRRGHRPARGAGPAASVRREDVNAPRLRVERAPDGVAEHLRVRVSVQHCHVCRRRDSRRRIRRQRDPGGSRMHGGGKAIERCGESGWRDGGSCRRPRPARISRCQERSVLAYGVSCGRRSSAGVRSAPPRNNDGLAGCETIAALTGMAVERSGSIADTTPTKTAARANAPTVVATRFLPRLGARPGARSAPAVNADSPARPLDQVVAERRHGEGDEQDQESHLNGPAHRGIERDREHDEGPVPQVDGVRDAAEEAKRREAQRPVREREPLGDAADDQQRRRDRRQQGRCAGERRRVADDRRMRPRTAQRRQRTPPGRAGAGAASRSSS